MKVILTEDVQGLGSTGDVTDVAQGYASNFLIPRKMAVPATPGNLKHWDDKRTWIVKREAASRAEAEAIAAKIEGGKLTIIAKAGEEGRLYGSVTVKDIAAKILDELKVEVDRKKILLPEPIKTAGEHEATVRIYKDVEAKVVVDVVGELEESEAPPVEEFVEKLPENMVEAEVTDEAEGTREPGTAEETEAEGAEASAAQEEGATEKGEGSRKAEAAEEGDSAEEDAAGGATDQPEA